MLAVALVALLFWLYTISLNTCSQPAPGCVLYSHQSAQSVLRLRTLSGCSNIALYGLDLGHTNCTMGAKALTKNGFPINKFLSR
uniref:Putative secreted protein n=1 Tax=Anopheles marajoara TaxID=58244 RepID=A0A2M4CB37_9DIPT